MGKKKETERRRDEETKWALNVAHFVSVSLRLSVS